MLTNNVARAALVVLLAVAVIGVNATPPNGAPQSTAPGQMKTPKPATPAPATPAPATPAPATPAPSTLEAATPAPATPAPDAVTPAPETPQPSPAPTVAPPPPPTTTPQSTPAPMPPQSTAPGQQKTPAPSTAPATTVAPASTAPRTSAPAATTAAPTTATPAPPVPTTVKPTSSPPATTATPLVTTAPTPVPTSPPLTTAEATAPSTPTTEVRPTPTTMQPTTPPPTTVAPPPTPAPLTAPPVTPSPPSLQPADSALPEQSVFVSVGFAMDVSEARVMESSLRAEVAAICELPVEKVAIIDIRAGSVIVIFEVVTRHDEADILGVVTGAVSDPQHPIRRFYSAIPGSVTHELNPTTKPMQFSFFIVGVVLLLTACVVVGFVLYRRRADYLSAALPVMPQPRATIYKGKLTFDGHIDSSSTSAEMVELAATKAVATTAIRNCGDTERVIKGDEEAYDSLFFHQTAESRDQRGRHTYLREHQPDHDLPRDAPMTLDQIKDEEARLASAARASRPPLAHVAPRSAAPLINESDSDRDQTETEQWTDSVEELIERECRPCDHVHSPGRLSTASVASVASMPPAKRDEAPSTGSNEHQSERIHVTSADEVVVVEM